MSLRETGSLVVATPKCVALEPRFARLSRIHGFAPDMPQLAVPAGSRVFGLRRRVSIPWTTHGTARPRSVAICAGLRAVRDSSDLDGDALLGARLCRSAAFEPRGGCSGEPAASRSGSGRVRAQAAFPAAASAAADRHKGAPNRIAWTVSALVLRMANPCGDDRHESPDRARMQWGPTALRPTIESRYGTARSAVNDRTLLTLSSEARMVHA